MDQSDVARTPSRRRVLAGGSGAALGISTLALPSAAVAASPGSNTPTQGSWVDTAQFSNGTTGNIYGVTFDGTRFVVGGRDKYFYSAGTDTSSWTEVSTGTSSHDWIHLASDGTDLVLGTEDSARSIYRVAGAFGGSPSASQSFTTTRLEFATYITGGPGDWSGLVIGTGDEELLHSTNGGATWTTPTSDAAPFNGSSFLRGLETDGTNFFALAFNDTKALQATDIDGPWSEVDGASNSYANELSFAAFALAYAEPSGTGTLVALIKSGVSGFDPMYSTNGGVDWSTATTVPSFDYLSSVVSTGDGFIAVGTSSGDGTISNALQSSDGITWTDISTSDEFDTFSYRSSAAFGGGRVVAVTSSDKVLVYVV